MSIKRQLALALIGTLGGATLTALGEEPLELGSAGLRFNPVLSAGLTNGGNTIATYRVFYFDGAYETDLDAGGTLFVFGGANLFWPRRHVGVLVQAGRFAGGVSDYDFDQLGGFTRWPAELIGFVEWKRFRVGAGASHHFSPKFKDKTTDVSIAFDDARGAVFQFDYLFRRTSLGWRYVTIDYDAETGSLNGDHWGASFTYRFGESGLR